VSSNGHASLANPNHQLSTLHLQLLTDLRRAFAESNATRLSMSQLTFRTPQMPEPSKLSVPVRVYLDHEAIN